MDTLNSGTLFIVATPIGNLQDITLRALDTLKSVDLIVCEDTRVTGHLLHHFTMQKPMLALNDFNEAKQTSVVLQRLIQGQSIALVSDAGTPLISDPGYKLVREAIAAQIKVESISGPSAAIAALTSSGLPPDKFLFIGFLPEKAGKRQRLLERIHTTVKSEDDTLRASIVIYESPYRIQKTLAALQEVFGDIDIVICRELTKLHEEIFRGPLSQAIDHFQKPKGEFVILL